MSKDFAASNAKRWPRLSAACLVQRRRASLLLLGCQSAYSQWDLLRRVVVSGICTQLASSLLWLFMF